VDDLLDAARRACIKAGDAAMAFHGFPVLSEEKPDGSLVTEADMASNSVLVASLEATGIPIVSEEGIHSEIAAPRYWLVDPLDGTREFLAGNGEFSVNVALIEGSTPVLGVIHAPAKALTCAGSIQSPATTTGNWEGGYGGAVFASACLRRMVHSRHEDERLLEIVARTNGIGELVAVGSALKFAALAVGVADYYVRFQGSSEWDTAAGQAILASIGGAVVGMRSRSALVYGNVGRRNPAFVACRLAADADALVVDMPIIEPS
jgi:3'(2'), 5'-bisphosphate nucleotidase